MRGLVTKHHNAHPVTPPLADKWLEEGVDPEYGLRVWAIYYMMYHRRISRADLAQHMGISKQRVQQMLSSEAHLDRVESAITEVTQERHNAICSCDDSSCAVYLASGHDLLTAGRMVQGKKEWMNG